MSTPARRTDGAPPAPTTVTVTLDGPYVISGQVEIRNEAGDLVRTARKVALCRCGQSGSKPYCDGTHVRVGFRDPGPVIPEAGA